MFGQHGCRMTVMPVNGNKSDPLTVTATDNNNNNNNNTVYYV